MNDARDVIRRLKTERVEQYAELETLKVSPVLFQLSFVRFSCSYSYRFSVVLVIVTETYISSVNITVSGFSVTVKLF